MRKIIFVAVAVLFSWNIASAQIPQIERDALIALYNSTNGATWSDNTGWLGAVGTECSWHGVFCSNGSVVWLYLGSNQLSGSIPPELEDLSGLQDLRLYSNQIGGSIPPELENLSSLQILSLGGNQLTGSIPPELGELTNVRNFSLGSNQLTGSIPPELGDLTNVTGMYLADNQLTGGIPPALENLSNLEYLHLNSNPLRGSIPPELGKLPSLLDLRLADTQLTGSIPPELGDLASLTSLSLSSNGLSGSIPLELGDLANLNTLLLHRNQLSGAIPPELENLSNLQYLHLQLNSLEGSIPPELGNLLGLGYLRLDGNQLSGSIPPELMNLSALQDGNGLDLRFDALHSDDAVLIAFLNQKQSLGDWQSYQTIAPENVIVEWVGDHTAWLSWDAVTFQGYSGGYEAFVSPAASGQWVSAGKTAAKNELEIPVTGLDAGAVYDFAVASYTLPSSFNQNTVTSDLGEPVMSTTAATGCAAPGIEISWGYPTTLSLTMNFDSYAWSTGETSPAIAVDPSVTRFYWVTVASSGPCQESAIVLVDQVVFSDDFDSGDDGAWSNAVP
jgi:Leucine Rich repeats (2 copies)/Leucine Rich Repeat